MEKKSENEKFIIPIEELYPTFKNHLDIENNSRIIFSGKYGIGKTYFLRKFFEEFKDEYEVFHLFPVNYQIASNEDIFKFLKYDILIEMINKKENVFEKPDYLNFLDITNLLYLWGKENFSEIIKTGLSFIPKIGRPFVEALRFAEEFSKFKNEIEEGELGIIQKYIDQVKTDSILENDLIGNLISEKLNQFKTPIETDDQADDVTEGKTKEEAEEAVEEKEKELKKCVLILDDLERIDPDHIFRLLNAFSSCYDIHENLKNKFNFDKILIVSDFGNLQSIFHHKYGEKTDFLGYIDKYFSLEVFKFCNDEIIRKLVEQIILQFNIQNDYINKKGLVDKSWLRMFLSSVLLETIKLEDKNKLNLRQLLKGIEFPFNAFDKEAIDYRFVTGSEEVIPQYIKIAVKALISIIGGSKESFLSTVDSIRLNLVKNTDKERDSYYKTFCIHMLNEVFPELEYAPEGKNDTQNTWKDYYIFTTQTAIKLIRKEINNTQPEVTYNYLFYDLLYEYVKYEHYNEFFDPHLYNLEKSK
jgi:hypothetical protein